LRPVFGEVLDALPSEQMSEAIRHLHGKLRKLGAQTRKAGNRAFQGLLGLSGRSPPLWSLGWAASRTPGR
jgi:hypothetical protein